MESLEQEKNADLASREGLVIARGKAKCPLLALPPPPRSLATSFSSAVPAFALMPGV